MAVGRPLVSTTVGCLPEYVVDGKTGFLVEPNDENALAKAIGTLVADPFLRETYGSAARARYNQEFKLERFIDQTEKGYEDALHPIPS